MRFMKKRAESAPPAQPPTAAPVSEEVAPWQPPAPGAESKFASNFGVEAQAEVPVLAPQPTPVETIEAASPVEDAVEGQVADTDSTTDVVEADEANEVISDDEAEVGERALAEANALMALFPTTSGNRHLAEHTYTAHAVAKAVGYHGLSIIPGSSDLSFNMQGEPSRNWVDAYDAHENVPEVDLDEVLTNATMRLVTVPSSLIFEDLVTEFGYRPTFVTPVAAEDIQTDHVPDSFGADLKAALREDPDAVIIVDVLPLEENTIVENEGQYADSVESEVVDDEATEVEQAEVVEETEVDVDDEATEVEQAEVVEETEFVEQDAEFVDVAAYEHNDAVEAEQADEVAAHDADDDEDPVWHETELSEPSQAEREALAALVSDLRSFSDLPSTPPMPPIEDGHTPRQD